MAATESELAISLGSVGPCSGGQFKAKLTQLDKTKPLSRVAANRENGFQVAVAVSSICRGCSHCMLLPLLLLLCKYVQLFKLTVRF